MNYYSKYGKLANLFASWLTYAKLMQQSMLHSPIILRNHLIQAYIDQQELESKWRHVISVNN